MAKSHEKMAEIVNVFILFVIGYVSCSCQMSWIDLDKAQILGRAGGRYSLFCYNMMALCLRYLPLSKTSTKQFFLNLKERLLGSQHLS